MPFCASGVTEPDQDHDSFWSASSMLDLRPVEVQRSRQDECSRTRSRLGEQLLPSCGRAQSHDTYGSEDLVNLLMPTRVRTSASDADSGCPRLWLSGSSCRCPCRRA